MRSKLKSLAITVAALALMALPLAGRAQDQTFGLNKTAGTAGFATQQNVTLFTTVTSVVNGLLGALAIVFLGLMTYAGVRWMTARGNEDFVTKAKETMIAAVIGLVVIIASYGITTLVFSKLSQVSP